MTRRSGVQAAPGADCEQLFLQPALHPKVNNWGCRVCGNLYLYKINQNEQKSRLKAILRRFSYHEYLARHQITLQVLR